VCGRLFFLHVELDAEVFVQELAYRVELLIGFLLREVGKVLKMEVVEENSCAREPLGIASTLGGAIFEAVFIDYPRDVPGPPLSDVRALSASKPAKAQPIVLTRDGVAEAPIIGVSLGLGPHVKIVLEV